MDAALNILTYKDRTVTELRKKLIEKGYEASEIDGVIEKLIEYHYLDDERYALCYASERSSSRGARVIRMELKDKGVDESLIALAMDETGDHELDTAVRLLSGRYRDADLNDEKVRRRVYGFLARRGFSYDTISKALSYSNIC